MPSRRFLLAFLLFLASANLQKAHAQTKKPVFTPIPTPAEPTATTSIVIDLESGRVLEDKNSHQRMFPASTTKLMTCLVALEHGSLTQVIRAGKNAHETGESGIYLLEGEQHTLAELVRAALVHSANDACVDIAEGVGGTQSQFVLWMNEKAQQLGCRDTHFVNPHGLHDPNHFTSAHDLAIIGRAVLQVPFLNEVVREKTATISGNWKIGPTRVMTNRNKLLLRWPQCDGLKTGYTKQAGNCLVASATQIDPATGQPWRLLAVAMKTLPGKSWGDCQMLLQRAFAGFKREKVAEKGEVLAQSEVKGGAFDLEATPLRDVVLPLRIGERQTLSRRVHLLNLAAPVAKGQLVGHVELFSSVTGRLQRIADVPLSARDAVPQSLLSRAAAPVTQRLEPLKNIHPWPFVVLFCGGLGAFITLLKRKSHVRRRPQSPFQNANLTAPGGNAPDRNARSQPRRDEPKPQSRNAGQPRPR